MKTINISQVPRNKTGKMSKVNFEKTRKIIHLVCLRYDLSYYELIDKTASRSTIEKKQIAATMAKKLIKKSTLAGIGNLLGIHHADVIYCVKRVQGACFEKSFKAEMKNVRMYIKNSL